ncbi:MAG TPA: glycosyltransferase family 2 protein [Elusimicrobiota bacterium]|jgi:glycosyltransferase involved in cell wall biosynthesis|nr:glycosyltransferase family 2 protein [Elusimicrobiota bacterium]
MKTLSILIPAYNEERTVAELVARVRAVKIPLEKDIIVVDDRSTDRTWDKIQSLLGPDLRAARHEVNQGKGAALRTALAMARGELVLVQDADLEYDPTDYPMLLGPLLDGRADVVYGSRFLGGPHRVLMFWHYAANLFFTLLTNVLYNINLTDMGVCYKVFRTDILRSFVLRSDRFGFEPEVTAKVCKRHLRVYEVPISYSGRTYAEGKKITWRDAFVYLYCLLRYRLAD